MDREGDTKTGPGHSSFSHVYLLGTLIVGNINSFSRSFVAAVKIVAPHFSLDDDAALFFVFIGPKQFIDSQTGTFWEPLI